MSPVEVLTATKPNRVSFWPSGTMYEASGSSSPLNSPCPYHSSQSETIIHSSQRSVWRLSLDQLNGELTPVVSNLPPDANLVVYTVIFRLVPVWLKCTMSRPKSRSCWPDTHVTICCSWSLLVADVFMGATFCFGPTTSAMASLPCLPRWYRPQSYFDSGTVLTTWYRELAWLEFSSAYWSLPFDVAGLPNWLPSAAATFSPVRMCRESLPPLPFLKTLPISMLPEVVVDFQYGTSPVSRYWYTSGCSKLPFCRLFSAETVATSEAAETSVPSAESTPTRGIRGIPNPRIRAQVITSASTLRWDFPACMSSPPWEPGGDVIVDIEHYATKTVPRQWVHIRGSEIIDNLSDYSAKSRVLSNNPGTQMQSQTQI